MALRIGTWIGIAASLASLIYVFRQPGQPVSAVQGGVIGVVVVLLVLLIIFDIRSHFRSRPRTFKSKEDINNYMYNWISKSGRVAIFTRDMSWAYENRIRELLHRKAENDELSICLPQHIPLTEELEQAGAQILSYEHLNYVPQSRFTIINKDRMDAYVAVGRWINDRLVIEELALGQHPVFSVANDLVEIILRVAANRKGRTA